MVQLKRILFPTDYSPCSDSALLRALWLADRSEAELHIVHALLPLDYEPQAISRQLPDLERIQQQIDKLSDARRQSVPAPPAAVIGGTVRGIAAAPAILEYASEHEIDLIVMGTHGRRGLNHLIMGSVAEEVVRSSHCPVLTVRDGAVQHPDFHRILVPLDFSRFSSEALLVARWIATEMNGAIHALHVMEETIHPSFYVTGQTSLTSWFPEAEATALKEMERLAREAGGPEVPMEYHVKEGRTPVDIVSFAKRNSIDLIVMASHGLTGLNHLLIGSVTEKVVRLAHCPVLVIKSFGRSFLTAEHHGTAEAE